MKIFTGDSSKLPERSHDLKGKTFKDDVYQDTDSGFQVLATKGELVSEAYYKAVMAGAEDLKQPSQKPDPEANKSAADPVNNK